MHLTENYQHDNFYVITGGPGVGKTTLLQALAARGYHCVEEVARRIIREEMAAGGDALPWKNRERYRQLMLEGSVQVYREADPRVVTFLDRGIPDVMAAATLMGLPLSAALMEAVRRYRYNRQVLLLPPWEEIYTTDAERKQSWQEALDTYTALKEAYTLAGYSLTEVPRLPVDERASFVVNRFLTA